MKTYTTVQGDMWDAIAHKQLGSCRFTDRLMRENPQYLGHYIFPAGIVLRLPDVDTARTAADTPPWRRTKG